MSREIFGGVFSCGSSRAAASSLASLEFCCCCEEKAALLAVKHHLETEKPSGESALIFSHTSEVTVDRPVPDELLSDS